MLIDDGGVRDGAGFTLPFAYAVVLRVEAHRLGRFRVVDLDVLAPLVGRGDAGDAHATGTLAGASFSMEPGKTNEDEQFTIHVDIIQIALCTQNLIFVARQRQPSHTPTQPTPSP